MNIRLIAGELLLNPNQVHYAQLSVDVEVSVSTSGPSIPTCSLVSFLDPDP